MKKSLIALAALAASGAAMAQSSVTLFGVVDATFAYGTGTVFKKTQLTSGGLNGSRLGFRGVEDLGGGMSASFHLEAGLKNDDGTGVPTDTNNQGTAAGSSGLLFNRRSTLSLNGGFGEVRLGRDYTPHFLNLTAFDPFGTSGVGTTQLYMSGIGGPTRVRASNSIGYLLPGNLGGFYGQGQFYMGENNSSMTNKKDGNGVSLRAGYANGPIDVAGSFAKTNYLINPSAAPGMPTGNITTMNFGGKYDLGMVKILGQYAQDKVIGTGTGKGFLGGVQIPVGPAGEVRLSFSTYKLNTAGVNTPDPVSNKIAAGYVHNLSKRTAVYGTFANVTNKKGASSALNDSKTAPNKKSSGFDFGIRHSF